MQSQKSKVKSQKLTYRFATFLDFFRSKYITKRNGFTLLESLIAIAIFTTGISASMFVITQSINIGTRTKHKIIASHLAQEGIEVVRNIRDRNWANGVPWNANIVIDCGGSYPCTPQINGCISWNDNVIDFTCAVGSNLFFDGNYYELTAANTQYSRTIDVTLVAVDHMVATSTVTCGSNCSISLAEDLFDWK